MSLFNPKRGEVWKEHRKATRFMWTGILIAVIVGYFVMKYSLALGYWLGWRKIIPEEAALTVEAYLHMGMGHVFRMYGRWFMDFATHSNLPPAMWAPFLFFPAFFGIIILTSYLNPHKFGQDMSTGREAGKEDYKKMGFLDGKYMVLGEYKKNILKLNDTRSVFCIGAPGSGKTQGVVIPTVLGTDSASLIVIDQWGDVFKASSGYRSRLGPVFKFDFEKVDEPEKGIYYPKWNPLASGNLPPPSPARYNYIAGLANYLVADPPGSVDPYWATAGRSALEGFTNYLCDKCDAARANDYFWQRLAEESFDDEDADVLESYYAVMPQNKKVEAARRYLKKGSLTTENYVPIGRWDPIPEIWHGRQACFAMLIDVFSVLQIQAAEDIQRRKEIGDFSAYNADPFTLILQMMQDECVEFAYSRRALLEINQLGNIPSQQRSSVLSFAMTGIAPFKNSAVRERTSASDILSSDMRGMVNPLSGKWEPVTVYMGSDNYGIAPFLANMTCSYLMTYLPNANGLGPYPVFYILDAFNSMAKMPSILKSVGSGRSQKVGFLVAVQDMHQIIAKYDENGLDILMTNTAVKIVKRLNNPQNSAKFTPMIPKKTQIEKSSSWSEGLVKKVSLSRKFSYKWKSDSILGGSTLNNMKANKQVLFVQGFLNRVCEVLTPFYDSHPEFKGKSQLKESKYLPDYIKETRPEEEQDMPTNILNG